MKRTLLILAVAAAGSLAAAQTTQSVTAIVSAINDITVTGSPTLTVTSAGAGNAPLAATDSSSSYAITTNETNKKITVQLDSALATGKTLSITMAAPSVGTSAGAVVLDVTAKDAVTGIANLNESGLGITYDLAATAAAAPGTETKTVTFTIANGI